MFTIYDWEKNTQSVLNEKAVILNAQEMQLLPCILTDRQIVSIVTTEKEVLMLPEFLM